MSLLYRKRKVESYLHRCVDSILNQTFTDFELILVDDGSPDNCPAICDEYVEQDNRVHVIHQNNCGLSAARNAGIEWAFSNSKSQWLTFVDSDDWVHPQYLQFLYNAVITSRAGISVCAFKQTQKEEIVSNLDFPLIKNLSFEEFYLFRKDDVNIITACGKLYRKEYFQKVRYPVGKINEDIFTTHKLLVQSPCIALVEYGLYFYFTNPSSIMRRDWMPNRLNEIQGYEELILYMQEHGYLLARIRVIETYYWSLDRQIKQLLKSSNREYRKYLYLLRKKLKRAIHQYKDVVPVSLRERHWLFEDIYPVRMWIYWKMRALIMRINI